jgi:four helix bundle protein
MNAERFEELRIWQNARDQCKSIYLAYLNLKDFGFKDQIQRAAVSVMNNIAEGFEKRTDADFANYLDIAKGSNGEVRSMLYLSEDLNYTSPEASQTYRDNSEQLSRAIQTLINYLRKKR